MNDLRAGFDDDTRLEELARAVEQGGAALLTVHCRTKAEHYCREVDWSRIARAVQATSLPVCGNGGVHTHADLERMRSETGCRYVMVGQAALGNPWIFSGREAQASDAARFLLDYGDTLRERDQVSERGIAGRIKQLLQHWSVGDLAPDPRAWLRETPEALQASLLRIAGDGRDATLNPLLPPAHARGAVNEPSPVP